MTKVLIDRELLEGWLTAMDTNTNFADDSVGPNRLLRLASTELRAVLEAAPKVAQPPEGWKLVPVEPTQEMLDAVVTTVDDHLLGPDAERQYREDWAAMLAAAPAIGGQQP